MTDALAGFTRDTFTHDGTTKEVFRAGSGPAVIVITEIPGITPSVIAFAQRVIDLGCSAVLPSVFGDPGREPSGGYIAKSMSKGCVSKEFRAFAKGVSAPLTQWCIALARNEHERCGGPGVGVVGMCFTGNFALAMAVDPVVLAPVLSQPSLPLPVSKAHKADVHASPAELAAVRARCEEDEEMCVLGLRFTGDIAVPAARFASLRRELGESFVGVEIDSSKGNVHHIGSKAHSVLTEDLVDEPGHPTHDALNQVLELFRARLLA